MITKTVEIKEAEFHLKELLSFVAKGSQIVLSENNKPVAQLIPISQRIAGLHEGAIWTSEDFNDPLPQDFWTGNK